MKNNPRREFLLNTAKCAGALAVLNTTFATNIFATTAKEAMPVPTVKLNNGVSMPIIGLGTYSINEVSTFLDAINVGYRLIDSAQLYGNEKVVGEAVKQSKVKREEFFITTKLSSNMDFKQTQKSIDDTLKLMNLKYLDLLLIHQPFENRKQMYKAMEEAYKKGKIKAIGVSNFTPDIYSDFVKSCEIIPAVNQCETHIFYQQKKLREVMKDHGTMLQSWSPFVHGKKEFFENKTMLAIAKKYNKTVAQVALRFLTQENIIVIPKAARLKYMKENLNIFDFELSKADMKKIQDLDENKGQFSYSR
ncbi:aldo/keto reductase [Campylobacter avium LMG 24591]|uniref:Aldo/keto reductase n=1 Tax=Campylobacter avium LMG 24591 TaxID=522484 RepID=A0A222MYS1_9BACT|nr:aldo/keto reductase [Campylobacter avium]ASQ31274.1 aldo/keto reductase [Campylobacter avium LMG 24591]OYD79948.1 aldo/keto reductase [Campylobacter avium]